MMQLNEELIREYRDNLKLLDVALRQIINQIASPQKETLLEAFELYSTTINKVYLVHLSELVKANKAFLEKIKANMEDLSIDIKYMEFDRSALLSEKLKLIKQLEDLK